MPLKFIDSDLHIFRSIMVKVWLADPAVNYAPRSFSLEKYVKEILDEFVNDPEKRSKCCMFLFEKYI